MAMKPVNNPKLDLASQFVNFTGKNIFLTGKAGTGKTTFLKNLKDNSHKRMVVVAPTGVAAINAGGVTIHSFFQLPFGPQLPYESASSESNINQRRFSKQKINIMKTIDLLVIDEISMVRADLLDGIDRTLRRFRDRNKPFGGVQLLMIGDLQQLAPVIVDSEWNMLRSHYSTPFFFGSIALGTTNYVSIELTHVYRQKDESFIKLLNKVRENTIDSQVVSELNNRFIPEFNPFTEGYITLTTHNAKAREINETQLNEIKHKEYHYTAKVVGNFPESIYPNDYTLTLKESAQVMFIKNDPNPEKLFYNGKIGKIIEIDEEIVIVECDGDEEPISVSKVSWEKIKYSINAEEGTIDEEIEGIFEQYPLKLAWAITIHKSQGLTFERAIIDAADAFAHGQVYVALSRCRTLEGIVLSSKISHSSVIMDSRVGAFNKDIESNQPDDSDLEKAKQQYVLDVLVDLFDFKKLQYSLGRIIKGLQENYTSVSDNPVDDFIRIEKNVFGQIVIIASRFQNQLSSLLVDKGSANESYFQDRIKKASGYFLEKLNDDDFSVVVDYIPESDNKKVTKVLRKAIETFKEEYYYKLASLKITKQGFKLNDYLNERAKAVLGSEQKRKKQKKEVSYSGDENNELRRIIKAWRDEKAREKDCEVYQVIQLKTINEICYYLPSNPDELLQMKGMGKKKMNEYSDELLEIIEDYKGEYRKTGVKIPLPEKKQKKKNTKEISYELFKEGKAIEEIATHRSFAVTTIEGHLAHYIEMGDINISEFVSSEKVKAAIPKIVELETTLLSEIKEELPDYSYSELRFIISHMKNKNILSG